jgi:hypothetical protein
MSRIVIAILMYHRHKPVDLILALDLERTTNLLLGTIPVAADPARHM